MKMFEKYGNDISYRDILQVDGANAAHHALYGKSPVFNGISAKNIEDELKKDKICRWKEYWVEYINAFDKLINILPDSVVTINVGRQAVEIGFKYLIVKKNGEIRKSDRTHNLSELADTVFKEYSINDDYMKWVDVFCHVYNEHIENGYVEYFRFPEYKNSEYFDGVFLDIDWLSYNFSLILLKLMHFAGIDDEIE